MWLDMPSLSLLSLNISQSPPKVIRTQIGSYLCGCTLTNMRKYVTVHTTGIYIVAYNKKIVFVTFYNFPGNPYVISPNYFDSPF